MLNVPKAFISADFSADCSPCSIIGNSVIPSNVHCNFTFVAIIHEDIVKLVPYDF